MEPFLCMIPSSATESSSPLPVCTHQLNSANWWELVEKLDSIISGFQTFYLPIVIPLFRQPPLFLRCHCRCCSETAAVRDRADDKWWATTQDSKHRSESFWWGHSLHHVPALLWVWVHQSSTDNFLQKLQVFWCTTHDQDSGFPGYYFCVTHQFFNKDRFWFIFWVFSENFNFNKFKLKSCIQPAKMSQLSV